MSAIVKHSVTIRGHRTSISLEQPFYAELEHEAARRGIAVAQLIAQIDAGRTPETGLSSAIRLYVLAQLKSRLAAN